MGQRRKDREVALQVLYQIDCTQKTPSEAMRLFWRYLEEKSDETEFAKELVQGVSSRLAEIDQIIKDASHHWRLERMARVDRNILRLGVFEIIGLENIPKRVTLNESVELAKRFGSDGSAGFVNGVLDRIATDFAKTNK